MQEDRPLDTSGASKASAPCFLTEELLAQSSPGTRDMHMSCMARVRACGKDFRVQGLV